MLNGLGAETRTVKEPLTQKSLQGIDCLIVVDPDTPKEAASPNLITDAEIEAVAAWVRNGGTLLLLGNDPGNCRVPAHECAGAPLRHRVRGTEARRRARQRAS